MKLPIYNINGSTTGTDVQLNDAIFGITPNEHAVWLDVKLILANQRQGTHKAKERSEISGSTRKLHKQKGTGGSRKGDINSPLFPGGGRVFGPKPRDYSFKLNKKLRALARKSVLSAKISSNDLMVIEDFNFDTPKTKQFVQVLNNLKLDGKKVLMVLADTKANVVLSSRNLAKSNVITADSINTYDLVNANKVVIAAGAIPVIEKILNR